MADTSRLGVAHGHVRLAVDDADSWGPAFERLATQLREVLGAQASGVEHVGSTAVPGMVAKPILDIVVGLAAGVQVSEVRGRLEGLGYQYVGDFPDQGGILFVLDGAPMERIAHVHLVRHGDAKWERYLCFRELLRNNESARAAYGDLKRDLAVRYPADRDSYTAGKDRLICELLQRAAPSMPR